MLGLLLMMALLLLLLLLLVLLLLLLGLLSLLLLLLLHLLLLLLLAVPLLLVHLLTVGLLGLLVRDPLGVHLGRERADLHHRERVPVRLVQLELTRLPLEPITLGLGSVLPLLLGPLLALGLLVQPGSRPARGERAAGCAR